MFALLACSALLAASPEGPPPAVDAQQAYREARDKAGRSSEAQIKLALWCEAHGLTAERLHHLTLAVLADPANATARGLMGLVSHEGRWRRPEAIAEKAGADAEKAATLAEYEAKRQKAAYTADAQWALGMWASDHGLNEQAKAHLTAVIRLDPSREAAWKKLGYRKHDGRWVTDAQLAAEKAESEAQKAADRKWKPLLEKLRKMLDQPSKRDEAEAALSEVTDPRAVPMILQVFATQRQADQLRAVQLLGQVDSPRASRALAGLAVLSKSAEVRRVSAETLRQRDSREYFGLLVGLIRDPIRYEVRPVGGPGSPGSLFIEGKKANVRRIYAPPPSPWLALQPNDYLTFDADGLPVVARFVARTANSWSETERFTPQEYMGQVPVGGDRAKVLESALSSPGNSYSELLAKQSRGFSELPPSRRRIAEERRGGPVTVTTTDRMVSEAELVIPIGRMMVESQKGALSAQQQLMDDVGAIESYNTAIKDSNSRVRAILKDAAGQDLGDDRKAWDRLWVERQGYAFQTAQTVPVPTINENVPLNYQPAPISPALTFVPLSTSEETSASLRPAHSCFAAGTAVRTIDGERPIESIRAGDLVLTQDTRTGALGYQAVIVAYHNPPSPTLKVKLGDEDAVVATGIHRFWKAGKGWTMARDLKAGDLVRTLGGVVKVSGVERDRTQPVFNLEVGEGHSFLVGKLGALVHDNSLVEATPAPFDAPATASISK